MEETLFLIIGDLHYQIKNRRDTDLLESEIIRCVKKIRPHIIVFLGDTLDEFDYAHSNPVTRISNFLNSLSVLFMNQLIEDNRYKEGFKNIIILIGNHDIPNNKSFLTKEHHFNFLKTSIMIDIIDYPKKIQIDNNYYTFTPYVPSGRFKEALNLIDGWRESLVVFGHQEIKGCMMKYIKSECDDVWDENILLILGHIHGAQEVGNYVKYPGTPYQTNFGEDKNKSLLVCSIKDKTVKMYKESIKFIPKETIVIKYNDINNFDLHQILGHDKNTVTLEDILKSTMIRLEIHCNIEQMACISKSNNISYLEKNGVKINKVLMVSDQKIKTAEESLNNNVILKSERVDFIKELSIACKDRGLLDVHNNIISDV